MAGNVVALPLLATRGSLGLSLFQGKNVFTDCENLLPDEVSPKVRVMTFSEDGSHFTYCNGESLKVLNTSNGDVVFETPKQKTVELVCSSKCKYIAAWEPFYTTPQNPQGSNNYEIFNIITGETVKSVIHKKQAAWAPAWTEDEKICARCVSNEVQFYDNEDFHTAAAKLYLQGVAGMSISPTPAPYMVSAYVVGKKGSPSFVRLFQYPNFGDGQAITNKSFFKADKVDMMWNKKGTALLILVSAEVDTTGSTYYGEQSLHFMSTKGESSLVPFDKRGPVYSVDWNPNSSQFCVVFGYMPAKATLFNLKCESIFDFGTGPRNICKFNAHGNILCLAGFGNLNGAMEMWNVDGKKLIVKPQARDTTHFEWCPDGQHIVTSTCAPRLRVGNGFKIWHYSGKELYNFNVSKNAELWQASWQPQPNGLFPVPRIVAGALQEVKKEAYRPPSARGTVQQKLTIHDDELPQNQRSQETLSATALKNKKKREAKAKSKQEGSANAAPSSPPATSVAALEVLYTGDPEKDKKIKGLKKKLKQIEDLKAKQREGKQLEKNQLDKITSEKDLLKELQALQIL